MYNHKNKTSFLAGASGTSGLKKLVLISYLYFLYPWKAVYNTMKEINILVLLSPKGAVRTGSNLADINLFRMNMRKKYGKNLVY